MGNIKAEEAMRELTLMLLYLSRFTQREKFHEATDFYAWKGYDFDILNELDDADYIRQGNHPSRSKSVYITESGMEQAKELGIHTILTSGQQNNCCLGKELLRQLVNHEDGRIRIMAGGGINPQTLKDLLPYTGARAWHMSGKALLQSPMTYRKKNISMGAASLDEFQILRTSASQIRQAKEILAHHKEADHVS